MADFFISLSGYGLASVFAIFGLRQFWKAFRAEYDRQSAEESSSDKALEQTGIAVISALVWLALSFAFLCATRLFLSMGH